MLCWYRSIVHFLFSFCSVFFCLNILKAFTCLPWCVSLNPSFPHTCSFFHTDTNASNDDDDDDDAILLVYAGRLSHEKRIDLLIEALHRLRSTSSQTNGTSQTKPRPIYLALVGDGPSANKYAQLHSAERGIYCKPRFLDHWELGTKK